MGNVRTVLVTGAAGYLGAKISLHLREMGYHVYALCRSVPVHVEQLFHDIEIIRGDITTTETLNLLLSKPISAVVHTVSLDHNDCEAVSIEDVNNINVLATWQLLNRFSKMKLEKFVFLSTMQVAGKLPLEIIDETKAKNPGNIYGLTHGIGEELVNFYNQKSETFCTSLRLSNGYGAPVFESNNCWWLVINDLCRSAFYHKKIVLNSDGSPTRDFIHIKDIARAVGFILEQDKLSAPLFNVSSGQTLSLLEIAHLVKTVYQQRYHTNITVYHSGSVPSEIVLESAPHYTISNAKLTELGFLPKVDLQEGIEELFVYFENLNVHGT